MNTRRMTVVPRPLPAEERQSHLHQRLHDRVRSGAWLASDVIQQVLDRVDRLNPTLNAIVALRHEDALRDARAIDERVRRGLPVGRLAGVPFTVMDTIATTGMATACGEQTSCWVGPPTRCHRGSSDASRRGGARWKNKLP